ncbi:hypothetical protein L1887_48371 [Cichorium endivia]|nr:hypothetical protein L1887_48371 [Cichorium endivia]
MLLSEPAAAARRHQGTSIPLSVDANLPTYKQVTNLERSLALSTSPLANDSLLSSATRKPSSHADRWAATRRLPSRLRFTSTPSPASTRALGRSDSSGPLFSDLVFYSATLFVRYHHHSGAWCMEVCPGLCRSRAETQGDVSARKSEC